MILSPPPQGQYLGMGMDSGHVLVWDMSATSLVSTPVGSHRERVGALAWKDDILCSGSRDRTIQQWDLRSSSSVQTYKSHTQVMAPICTYVHISKVGKVFSPFLAGTEEPFTYPLTVHATASREAPASLVLVP